MRERAAGVEGGMALGVGEPQLGCRPSSQRIQFICVSLLKIYLSMIVQQQDGEVDAREIFTHACGSNGEQAVLQM